MPMTCAILHMDGILKSPLFGWKDILRVIDSKMKPARRWSVSKFQERARSPVRNTKNQKEKQDDTD